VIYFLSIFYLVLWIIFCYHAGDYPSQQLMLALFAYTAWFDSQSAARKKALIATGEKGGLFSAARPV
jgi:hypothetical protein